MPPETSEALAAIALSLRERVEASPSQRYRLVGVGLSNFREACPPPAEATLELTV